ncbi:MULTISPECIES: hypothetical protein [unclassified Pseudoalteromonas]|uniref:hypothetical protein n=1 Tax=unclassified Pseudoalteromonas TaxID=194690 RepID=UPI001F33427D|nr:MULTISPECIES: hypothetical protein [unclassified Pseudoalteromonas]MCF2828823.1 hypothetical protein [Pseudoalteromonas sp. OF5H-5]MCF2831100.1 hypothetical protein [Pseudoalteromonas sp. DL2-H6]MCF2925743.1 hypothetical protein [Pseudoalteromonas sp. DL2-H1]
MIKKLLKPARKLHKYLGYLLFLQIFAWLLGGLVMSAIPLAKIHGKHLAHRSLDNPFPTAAYQADLNQLVQSTVQVRQIQFGHFLDTPIIKLNQDEKLIFNGITGAPFTTPNQQQIIQQAKQHLLIAADVSHIERLATAPREAGYKEDVWRVEYNDILSTTLYLSATSGEVVTVRSTLWRIFDFFWMLHIMDYDEREDFNNPLLISFAATSVLFCLTGILLLLQSPPWRKRRPAPNK